MNERSDISADHREQTSTLLHTASTTHSITSEILTTSTHLQNNLANLSIGSAQTHTEILAIRQDTVSANTSLVSVGQKLDNLCREVDAIRTVTCELVSKPSLLSSFCDETQRLQSLLEITESCQQNTFGKNAVPRQCNCYKRTQKISQERFIGPVKLFRNRKITSRHLKHCPFYVLDEETRSFGLKVTMFSRLLSGIIQLSFEATTGSGGFSLGRPLYFRAVVPYDSPAFALIEELEPPDPKLSLGDVLALASELRKLYRNGDASPYDVNPCGETLLHVSIISCQS
jgi:hypothetical protein